MHSNLHSTSRSLRLAVLLAALVAAARPVLAEEAAVRAPARPRLHLSIETDPADWTIYDGWGFFVGIRPSATSPWRFRLGGGAASLPTPAVETNDNNEGWKMRLDPVVTLAAHRYFGGGRGGFFAGPVVGWSSVTFTAPGGGTVDVRNLFAGGDIGYRWFPFDKLGLVITPHFGVIVPFYKSGEPTVGTETYDLLPVVPLPQILVGYECDI